MQNHLVHHLIGTKLRCALQNFMSVQKNINTDKPMLWWCTIKLSPVNPTDRRMNGHYKNESSPCYALYKIY